jgi:hypothetical protein
MSSRSNSSQGQAAQAIVQELTDLIDEQLDEAESFLHLHQEMDEERRVQISRHQTLLELSGPVAPSTSSISRRPVGAPPRHAASTNNTHSMQQPSQQHRGVVTHPSVSGSQGGHGRNDSVMRTSSDRETRARHRSNLAHDAPIPVQFDSALQAPMLQSELSGARHRSNLTRDAPISVQFDPALQAPMLASELHSAPTREAAIPVRPQNGRNGGIKLNAQTLAQFDRISAQEDRACRPPTEVLIPYYGIDPNRPDSELRKNPPLDVTTRVSFRNSTAANMDTSYRHRARDSMAVTILHHVDDVVPRSVERLVSTPYQAPYDRFVNVFRVLARAAGRFRRRRAAPQHPAKSE